MPVLGPLSYTLEVPSIDEGIKFYTDAGLEAISEGTIVRLGCSGQNRASVILIGGAAKKRLHHIAYRASNLDEIAASVGPAGGKVVPAPEGFSDNGLWVTDPHGLLYHLVEHKADPDLEIASPFEINGPGRVVRTRRSAVLPLSAYPAVKPRKLGHIVTFSPDVLASVKFVTEVLGMGLSDHSRDIIAFTCAVKNSDHHILAFAKSENIGFHHASFMVADPDEVGRGGRALLAKAGKGNWGFGRHTIGSNFFHYIQDPWGSWFEYYADMDHIDDHALWNSTNYAPEDSLASWGPNPPADFGHNYEVEAERESA
jgi:catechol 2,3-dioxygenase-like lactoylglutathione lyase family enzyme